MNLFTRSAACFLAITMCLSGCQKTDSSADSSSAASSSADSSAQETTASPNYSVGLTEDGLYDGIRALDYVVLPDNYDSIPGGEEFSTVSEEELQDSIDDFMAYFATDAQITDRAVEDGDLVNLDYVGYIDGETFSGGDTQGQGADYTAGSSALIDDFLTQIIGAMPGDTLNVEVTFPDPYANNTDLSGKDAVFVTTINYIHGESQVPELTDEFVTENLTADYGYTSVEDLRAQFTENLLAEQQYNYVLDWLHENSQIDVPDQLVEDQVSLLREELESYADYYGVTADDLASNYGFDTMDDFLDTYRPQLKSLVEQHLMCQALAEDAGLTVTEQEVSDYFSDVLGVSDYSAYLTSYGQGYVYQGVRTELVAQYLIDHVQP